MTTVFDNIFIPKRWPPWMLWLGRELAPFPGRGITTFRMVVTVVLVTVISMTLQVPNLFLSAFFIFFVTKENRALTAVTGIVMIIGATIATAISLFLFRFTFDYPELRVPVLACSVFFGMFMSRTFVIGPLGFVIGFFSALMQTLTENAPNTDALVRGELWLWVSLIYPIALTVVINQVLLPAHPWDVLVRALQVRLDAAATALRRIIKDGSAGGQTNPGLLDLATRGGSALCTLLNYVESQHPELKPRHAALLATIAASDHLVRAAASLEFRERVGLSGEDVLCARALLGEITQLQEVVKEHHPSLAHRSSPPVPATLPQLRELQFAIESFRDGLIRESSTETVPAPTVAPKKHLFVPDAFTNPSHVRFALKVTLAAMFCYVLYSGLDWPGISTAFVTCCFIALGNTGATLWKGGLRLVGCAVGGLFGYISIIFLIPHMESITSLILLVAIGSALSGWVANGSDRISYAGLQAAFAFYMCLFQGYEPGTNFTIVRDRLVGIIIGIVASSLVSRLIWPEHAIDSLRGALARVLRDLARFLRLPKIDSMVEREKETADALRLAIIRDLDNTLRLSEVVSIEDAIIHNKSGLSPAVLERMAAHTQALSLISFVLLGKTKVEEWQRLEAPVQQAEADLRAKAAGQLEQVAAFVESGQAAKSSGFHAAYVAWHDAVAPVTQNDRPRLVRRLIAQVRELHGDDVLAKSA